MICAALVQKPLQGAVEAPNILTLILQHLISFHLRSIANLVYRLHVLSLPTAIVVIARRFLVCQFVPLLVQSI